uniref:Proteasome activator PA28 C-terminal domain-containing protein n=1 Tax=Acrobeloides nanus TaxID=290746 RepID=A0A914DWQ5_9BILA
MIYSNDNKIEQASKNYEPTSPEQEEEAFEFILELPKIREKFQNFLEDKKLSRDRLVVGDILPDFDDILKEKGCQDFYTRITYIGLMVLSGSIIIGYMNYNDNLPLNSIVLLSLITFAISFYQLTVHMVNRHYDMCDREYEVLPNKKLLELNEMLERELEVLADKFYKFNFWKEHLTPPVDYGENLSNSIWPIIDQLSANVTKDISAFIILLATNESDELRYKHALSLGVNRKANGAQYLKNVQLIDKGQFKSIRGCLKLLTSDLSLLYDAFMKNYSSLNLKLDKNLSNYY